MKNLIQPLLHKPETKGVLVGSNQALEWLLPWWWERYSYCNSLPVAFADFGLSKQARRWCEDRGEVISLGEMSSLSFVSKNKQWEKSYGASYQNAREGWFRKPLALVKSPYSITLWCDLDCEVLQNIEPLFSFAKPGPFLALAREVEDGDSAYPLYNGGVLLFRKGTPLIEDFAVKALTDAEKYWGDDRLLSCLINASGFSPDIIPPVFNWRIIQGVPAGAYIIHWAGEWGKEYIRSKGGLKPFLV